MLHGHTGACFPVVPWRMSVNRRHKKPNRAPEQACRTFDELAVSVQTRWTQRILSSIRRERFMPCLEPHPIAKTFHADHFPLNQLEQPSASLWPVLPGGGAFAR